MGLSETQVFISVTHMVYNIFKETVHMLLELKN